MLVAPHDVELSDKSFCSKIINFNKKINNFNTNKIS